MEICIIFYCHMKENESESERRRQKESESKSTSQTEKARKSAVKKREKKNRTYH